MDTVLKIFIFGLLAIFIFGRGLFPSEGLYWACYGLSFVLLVFLWFQMYGVSRKKAKKVLGFEPEFDIFCGRVPYDVNDDLSRGRLCVGEGKICLVKRENGQYKVDWQEDIVNVTAIRFKKVIGVRRGFNICRGNLETSFACGRIKKHKDEFFKALGWSKEEKNV